MPERAALAQPDTELDLPWSSRRRHQVNGSDRVVGTHKLIILPGGHFDAYTVGFDASSGRARDWFVQHLAA